MSSQNRFNFLVITVVGFLCFFVKTNGQGKFELKTLTLILMAKIICMHFFIADVKIGNDTLLEELEKLRTELREVARHVLGIERNPFPAGFIYIQYYRTSEPTKLWPTLSWQEVTQNYAGLFFRAGGGGAATFGYTQSDNAPRLTNINHSKHIGPDCSRFSHFWTRSQITLPIGKWSSYISTGAMPMCQKHFGNVDLTFYSSGGEVRPRNQAVRIWQVIPQR